jgi:uncharacterized protein (TIGR02466 family)
MIIQNLFTNILAIEQDTNLDNKKLEKYCLNLNKNHKDKSNTIYFNFKEPQLKELFNLIYNKVNELHKNLELSDNYKQEFLNSWLNVSKNEYISIPHNHNDTFGMMFSGVYYVNTDNESSIEFVNPNKAQEFVLFSKTVKNFNTFNSNTMTFQPKTGDLIIFPSWLTHYVIMKPNNKNRISIAFNTIFNKK